MTDETDKSYADEPQSIGEIKADRADSGAAWPPRDCLIQVLRMLDSGEIKPETLVCAWMEGSPRRTTHSRIASQDTACTSYLLADTLHWVHRPQ